MVSDPVINKSNYYVLLNKQKQSQKFFVKKENPLQFPAIHTKLIKRRKNGGF